MLFGYILLILEGSIVTLGVAIFSLIIATLLGITFAFLRISKISLFNKISLFYTTIIRGIPELVLMLMIYYGGQMLINEFLVKIGFGNLRVTVNSFVVGVGTIGFIYGAYMSETFRGAILAIERGQIEAGIAFGFNRWTLFYRIIFPQMFYHGIASFTNNWLVLLKTVSLVSLIGLSDMVQIANLASGSTKQPFLFYGIVSLIFLFFTSISLWLLKLVRGHYHFD
jgi:arginine/ornithine transport system permease protein